MVKNLFSAFLFLILVVPFFNSVTSELSLYDNNVAEITTHTFNKEKTLESLQKNELTSIHNFGDQEDFWTANLQTNEWFTVRATLLSVGTHCYIYMDNRTISFIGQSEAIRRSEIYSYEFDQTIYSKNCELMGDPSGTLGDIDGDPRITVFLVENVGSYYLQHNELIGSSYSNNREMVYVNSEMELYNTIRVICHETNHLFLFNYDLNEAVFMIEGLAEFSSYYAGYMSNSSFIQEDMVLNMTYSAYYYSIHPDVSLLYFDSDYYSYASYGAGYMFVFYIAEKYGIQIIKDLISIDLDGPEALEHVLSNHGYNIDFNDLFLDFITACTIDQLGIYNDIYGFLNADYQISVTQRPVSEYPKSFTEIVHRYYGIEIFEFSEIPDKFTLELETPNEPASLGVVIIIRDENGWNITQTILKGNGTNTRIYCNGENIQKAYIVSSKIRLGITAGPRIWMTSPISKLDISIESGHINPDKTNLSFLSILPFMIAVVVILKLSKKKIYLDEV
jgi:hypothetical protein